MSMKTREELLREGGVAPMLPGYSAPSAPMAAPGQAVSYGAPAINQQTPRQLPQVAETAQPQRSEQATTRRDVAGGVSGAVSSMAQAEANLSADQYARDMTDWQAQGKYWFDPNANLKPDIDAYLDSMPLATDALKESTLMKGWTNTGLSAAMLDPVGVAVGASGSDMAAHAWHKGGERAVQGAGMAGPWGALAGGAIGVIEGIFGWKAAENEDAENKKKAIADYRKRLDEWTFNRNKRLAETKNQYESDRTRHREAKRASEKVEVERTEGRRIASTAQKRQAMMSALMFAGSASQADRSKRSQRWGR